MANASRWTSPEFIFYYACIAAVHVYIFPVLLRLSSDANPGWQQFSNNLSPGWLFGRMIDNSDHQYRSFRDNLPTLAVAMLGYLGASWAIRKYATRDLWRLFLLAFSLVFIYVMHGVGLVKIVALVTCNYLLSSWLSGTRYLAPAVWTFGVGVLFLNDFYGGYKFGALTPHLEFLDGHGGMMSRWYINFNMTLLRMLSFSMDRHWSMGKQKKQALLSPRNKGKDSALDFNEDSEKNRTDTPRPDQEYNYLNYLTYCLYIPLYLAGPIISFNNFMSQIYKPIPTDRVMSTLRYFARLVGVVFLMEVMMHCIYVVAINKASAWNLMTPLELSLFSYYNLNFIWLKLLIIWRFFRFWAMADGVETVENMTRCMSNSYSVIDFWRSWHRSYNKWTTRYIYIPLGGRPYRAYNTFVVFTFVAIWHDIQLRLLIWGWLVSLLVLPEIVVGMFGRKYLISNPFYRHMAALASALNLLMLIMANLVGFCVGVEGGKEVFPRLFDIRGNFWFVMSLVGCAYVVAQIAFEWREEEKRRDEATRKKISS